MSTTSILAPLLTGLGLFFCGVRFIAANLTPLAGPTARRWFRQALGSVWTTGAVGLLAGLVTQSTNAVSLVTVGLVRADVIPEERAPLLPAWSHVGAAALVILVSLHSTLAVAYALALAGAALYFDFELSDRLRHAMLVMFGAGLLFLGMQMLSAASVPLRVWLADSGLLARSQSEPAAPLLLGLVLAAVTQSSTMAGAIAVALVSVGVFDLPTALVLLVGASAGSAVNYAILARRGDAVGRHILLFQAAQKLFGSALLAIALAVFGSRIGPLLSELKQGASMAFATAFLAVQVAGSLACTLLYGPLSRLLKKIAPPEAGEALGRPAYLLQEALADPSLALDLVAREEHRLLIRLPTMLDSLRDEGDKSGPSAETLRAAGIAVGEAIRRYLAAVLAAEPGRDAVMLAMRLQRGLDGIVALHEAVEEFERVVRAAAAAPEAQALGRMVESLHMLLEVLVEIGSTDDPAEQAMSLSLLGDREQVMEALRARLMSMSADAPARVQEAVFRSTVLFERILWLARDAATASMRSLNEAPKAQPALADAPAFTAGEASA
jgi:phosphate:Na+ symporter